MRDKLLELCYIGQHFLQLVSSTTDHVQKGVLLGDIKRCYDTKQQIQKFVAATKMLHKMSVEGYFTLGKFRATCVPTKLRDKL